MKVDLNTTNIAAYLGAAAWVPQIFRWAYTLVFKPRVTIIPEKWVSIGYTTFGPIFNLRLSINVSRKDTVIDFLGFKLRDQSGAEYKFEWSGMTEFFSEVKNNKGESQVIQRDITPIAIKLNTLSLTERFFRFRESSFVKNWQIMLNKLMEEQQYIKRSEKNYHDKFLISKSFDNYIKFMKENFLWRAGDYIVSFYVRSPSAISLRKNTFKFKLTQDDVDRIQKNLGELRPSIEYYIKKPDVQGFEGREANWAWINSELHIMGK